MFDFKQKIRDIPDFPKKGIIFRDISPLLADGKLFHQAVKEMATVYKGKKIDKVVGVDARGFILAAAIANELNIGMVMVRKRGKLPFETESEEYELEYGKETLEIQKDAVQRGEKVLLVDDVLATGGTMFATTKLVEKLGGKVEGISFLIVLENLGGTEKLKNYKISFLIKYR